MYLNKIDTLINSAIDDFYTVVILKSQDFQKILADENFIKYQEQLNAMVQSYIAGIPESAMSEITKKKNSIDDLLDTIKRYCMIYSFLTIGATYKGKPDMFINNIIEFTKNQAQYPLRINNFFNSESNAELIKMYYIVSNILKLLEKPEIKYESIRKEPYSTDTTNFLKELGAEYIDAYFRKGGKTDKVDKRDNIHNIIKTLMVLAIYKQTDMSKLYNTIEEAERNEGNYIFIDIVEPITEQINFMTVESLLNKEDAMKGVAHDLWSFMQSVKDEELEAPLSNDQKIDILINSGLVIPILDDFMLYHRDTERYDKVVTEEARKKEDTKIRYIIGKIDTTAELYSDSSKSDSKLKSTIMKNFSAPLYNRKAILRNDIEEIKIINKFINQGRRAQEKNDYLNDLIFYRKYVYLNFKDFDKYGFSHTFSKTVQAVRAVNFDKESEFKQINDNHKMQRRVGTKGSTCNVVGLMIKPTTKPVLCLTVGDAQNIKTGKKSNGFDLFYKKLIDVVIRQKDNTKALYWMFDLNTDSSKKASAEIESIKTVDSAEQSIIKSMLGELYDMLMSSLYYDAIDKIDLIPDITPQMADKVVTYVESALRVPLDKKYRSLIKTHIYKKYETDPDNTYAVEIDDILYGIEGDVIKLPEYAEKKELALTKVSIDLAAVETTGIEIDVEKVEGVCQHNISWDNISQVKKIDYAQHMKEMYEFIQRYIVEDTSGDFVCKSCGYYVDIARFIIDGKFDDFSQKFVTFAMPMEVNIIDLPEYRKLDFSIKIMDKNIDKICSSVGIPFFVGSTTTVKWRRQAIVKSAIDMVRSNNTLLSKTFKAYNDKKEEVYGVSRNLSSMFIFEMENTIYITSSKDKDQEQFKMIKRNNIIVYIIIYLIMELNESQLSFFVSDKGLCDIRIFDKVFDSLFRGLKIKKNNSTDTVPIMNYKILCYAIYMLSCRIAKHRLWYSAQSVQSNINKMIPVIQRFVVNTFVDILNSILENSFKPGVPYIFEIFRVKFYSKLSTVFADDSFYDILLNLSKEQYAIAKRRENINAKIEAVPPFKFYEPVWRTVMPERHFLRYRVEDPIKLYDVSNLTNCPDGQFHKWKVAKGGKERGANFVCSVCDANMATIKYDAALSKSIIENFKQMRLNILGLKFCLKDGQPHQYQYNSDAGKNICVKCGNPDTHKYSSEDLKKVDQMLESQKAEYNKKAEQMNQSYITSSQNTVSYIESVVSKNLAELNKSKTAESPFKFIADFIDVLQKLIGDEIKGEFPIHLTDNTYVVDHDYYGNRIAGEPIIIKESDKKVNVKPDHPHYKTDVIYYTDLSTGRVDVFYDAVSRKLLGYKEASKDYVDYTKSDKKIRINYSLINKLYIIGYSAQYLNIYDINPDLSEKYENKTIDERQEMYRSIISNLCRDRVYNLKKVIVDFQRILNRILNDYIPEKPSIDENRFEFQTDESKKSAMQKAQTQSKFKKRRTGVSIFPYAAESDNPYAPESLTYFADKVDDLVNRYKSSISKIRVTDGTNSHKIFKHWKAMARGVVPSEKSDVYLNSASDIIDTFVVNRYDTASHQLLFYILREFTKLLDYNKSSYTKTSISNFIAEFIDRIFFEFNSEHLMTNIDIRRFMYIVSSAKYIKEISQEGEQDVKKEGFYDEVVEEGAELTEADKEQQLDDDEEADAMDVDMEYEDMEDRFSSRADDLREMHREMEDDHDVPDGIMFVN